LSNRWAKIPPQTFAAVLVFAPDLHRNRNTGRIRDLRSLGGIADGGFIFLIDAFSGPGMSGSRGLAQLMPTRKAADVLIDAGAGQGSPGGDWIAVGLTTLAALLLAAGAFWLSARPRSR
jgi:hypothetical protein